MTETKTPTRLIEEARRVAGFPLTRWGLLPSRVGHEGREIAPMVDGYWTPWHSAVEQIAMRDEELRELRRQLRAADEAHLGCADTIAKLRAERDACSAIRHTLNQTASRQAVEIADLRAELARLKGTDE